MMDHVLEIAADAGAVAMRYYADVAAGTLRVETKDDASPVTRADREANALIVERLAVLMPGVPAIAEESDLPPYADRKGWTRFWLVDPIDGTKEFLKHNGEFSVNIALVEAGVPVLGVIHAPALGVTYYAEAGRGAYKQQEGEAPVRIHSAPPALDAPLRVLTSRSHAAGLDLDRWLPGRTIGTRIPSGSALKFGLLSEGVGDVYVRDSGTSEWDVAAGDCIYRNSSREETPRRTPFRYNKPDVRNPGFALGLEP